VSSLPSRLVAQLCSLSLATLYTAIEATKADSMANVSRETLPTTSMCSLGKSGLKALGSVSEGCAVPSVPFRTRNEPMAPITISRQIVKYFLARAQVGASNRKPSRKLGNDAHGTHSL
jgi:hypothetical protein